jgi:hypothetical protein
MYLSQSPDIAESVSVSQVVRECTAFEREELSGELQPRTATHAAEYHKALLNARPRLQRVVASYFAAHAVAVVVYPTVPVVARPTRGAGDSRIEVAGEFRGTHATLTRNTGV